MKKNYFLTYFILILLVSGCSSDYVQDPPRSTGDTVSYTSKSAGDGIYDLLGYGYDIKGEYANASYGKSKIFDIDKIKALDPNRFEESIINNQSVELFSGSNAEEYKKNVGMKFGAKASGLFKLFDASVNANFSQDITINSKFTYASYDYNIEKKELKLYIPNIDYNKFLTMNFKEDVVRLSPKEIVEIYGTHVLTNITLGARMNILYRGESKNNSNHKAFDASANVKFAAGKIFGLDISGSGNISTTKFNSFINQSLTYKSMGGNINSSLSSLLDISDPVSLPKINISNWISSINNSNITLTKINYGGLIPIYELIKDDKKSEQVEKYIETNIDTPVPKSEYEILSPYTFGKNFVLKEGDCFLDTCYQLFDGYTRVYMVIKYGKFVEIARFKDGSTPLSTIINIPSVENMPTDQKCHIIHIESWINNASIKINKENNKIYLVINDIDIKKAYLIKDNNTLTKYNFKNNNISYDYVDNLDDYIIYIL